VSVGLLSELGFCDKLKMECHPLSVDDIIDEYFDGFTFCTKPYHHQLVSLLACMYHRRLPVLLDMRMGKSKVALDFFRWLIHTEKIKSALVLTLRTMVLEWVQEANTHAPDIDVHTDLGGPKDKRRKVLERDGLVISNHEIVKVLPGCMDRFDLVILDESASVYRHYNSKLTRHASAVFQDTPNLLMLTGTATANRGIEDLYGQWCVLDGYKSPFGSNYYQFKNSYYINVGSEYPDWRLRDSAIKKAEEILSERSIRYKKNECMDIPPVSFIKVPIMMNSQQMPLIKAFEKEGGIDSYVHRQGVSSGWVRDEDGDIVNIKSNKVQSAIDIICGNDGKFIVWSRFLYDLDLMEEALSKAKIRYTRVDGSVKQEKVFFRIKMFKDEPQDEVKVLLAQSRSISRGHTIPQADQMIYLSHDWDIEIRQQSLERNYSPFKKGGSVVYDIVSVRPDNKKSVDEMIIDAYSRKISFNDYLRSNRVVEDV